MSYPILYSATETQFNHNGLGILGDCAGYEVFSEGNGPYDLTMLYPVDGIHFDEISDRSIIKAKFDKYIDPQLFRVKTINKSTSGLASVYAEHISYDLSGIPVSPFSALTASSALEGLKNNAVTECPFDFWTDKETQANFKVSVPSSIRSRLGGVAGSILDVYGGEYEFDNYTVKLHENRGENRGFSIRYGKNLTDIQQDRNCANVATGIYPYWVSAEGSDLVELPEKIVYAPGTYNFQRIITVDFSQEFEQRPTVEELQERAERYVEDNDIGVPVVSLSVSFEQLSKSEEYKHLALLERVSPFDIVNVEFPALGVSATAKVVKIVYDGLTERIKTVTLGSVRSNIADTIAKQGQEIGETAKNEALRAIKGQSPESVFNILTDGGRIQGIYVQDDVWYINAEIAKVVNLIAESVKSESENSTMIVNSAMFKLLFGENETVKITNQFDGLPIVYMKDYSEDGVETNVSELTPHHLKVGGTSLLPVFYVSANSGVANLWLNAEENGKELFWKDNGDGTYNLAGR